MNDARKKMLDKVRAILAKTMSNGCTEDEAMAALAKARELMATYEIDESELKAEDQEKARIYKSGLSDPYEIKCGLCNPVGRFTRCKGYNEIKERQGICFCGLESDVIFAEWLLATLQRFIMRALRNYQGNRSKFHLPNSNHTSTSFVIGCTARIAERLRELTPVEPIGKGLVVSRNALIDAELARNGIELFKANRSSRNINIHAANAGSKAGNDARFNRPVGTGGRLMLK